MYSKYFVQGLQNGKIRFVTIVALALALLIPTTATTFAADGASGDPVPSGTICVEGLVIDWQEEPIEEGWIIEARPIDPNGNVRGEPVIAFPSLDEDEKGQFEYPEGSLEVANRYRLWQFEIKFDGTSLDPVVNGSYEGLIGEWVGVTPTAQPVLFESDMDQCVRIRFKLKELVAVTVLKIDADHNPLGDWKIIATPDKDNLFAYEQDVTTAAAADPTTGVITGTGTLFLTPGKWIFTEEPPEDEMIHFMPVIPQNGRQVLLLESAEDRANDDNPENDFNEEVTDYVVRFKNDTNLKGCIEVFKLDVPPTLDETETDPTQIPFGLAGWEISVLRADGGEERFGYTDASGRITFEHLPFGPYTVREESRTGWDAVSPDAYDVHVTPDDDGCVEVVFTNEQAPPVFVIEGYKLDANGHYGIPNWEIKAEPLSKNGFEPANQVTDGLGYYRFELPADDYRVPGSKYEICEDDEVDGWLPHTPTCYTVTLPQKPGTVKVPDFVNQQVGHTESQRPSGGWNVASMGGMDAGWNRSHMGGMDDGWSGGNMGSGMMGGMDMKCSKYHKVQKGEGLYEIGAMYMKPAGAMLAANSWIKQRPHHYLYPGDKVCVP